MVDIDGEGADLDLLGGWLSGNSPPVFKRFGIVHGDLKVPAAAILEIFHPCAELSLVDADIANVILV